MNPEKVALLFLCLVSPSTQLLKTQVQPKTGKGFGQSKMVSVREPLRPSALGLRGGVQETERGRDP
jgi:hypothetical protein